MSFNQNFYKSNRKRLAQLCSGELIIVSGNSLMQRSADTTFPFRQESNFLYLTGVSEPNLCLVIDSSTGVEFIMSTQKSKIAKIFDGDIDELSIKNKSGIEKILSFKEGFDYIEKHYKGKRIFINAPQKWNKTDFTVNGFRQTIKKRLQKSGIKTTKDIRPSLAGLRMIKQRPELEALKLAVDITKQALGEVESVIDSCDNEHELLRIVNIKFAKNNVKHGYDPIVAAGKNANTLHYIKNNQPLNKGDVVLLDVGAEVSNYSADISRTYIKGKNARAQTIIKAVKNIQVEIINEIKPGVTWQKLSNVANDLVANELAKLKIIKNKNQAKNYFPHAIGHFLGLDVHDSGDYTKPLSENMVITIEPGIYVPEEQIGVRIEDDILITKTGAKML